MSPADIHKVYEIERVSFEFPFSESFVAHLYFSSPELCFVLEAEEKKLIGFLVGGRTEDPKEAHILSIAILEEHRGKGYGEKLLHFFIEEVKNLGFDKIRLEVRPDNEVAISLYEKCGFEFVGTLRKYYEDNSDAYIYKLKI
ncbi:MAG: ribosomal protein S18-alanine N-acetyltransferase [Candidatus Heimdallarchaeaceae archaeon]